MLGVVHGPGVRGRVQEVLEVRSSELFWGRAQPGAVDSEIRPRNLG
jgi:hypothetical protein